MIAPFANLQLRRQTLLAFACLRLLAGKGGAATKQTDEAAAN